MRALCPGFVALLLIGCGSDRPVPTAPDPQPPAAASGCARMSTGLVPLVDLRGAYQGRSGGLYQGGATVPPDSHVAAGESAAAGITPLDQNGVPAPGGRYVFISIGMSNTTQEFSTFKPLADADPAKNPRLTIVDAAQGGVTADQWASPRCPCWTSADQRLAQSGVAPAQVVTAWIKLANARPTQPFPVHADMLRDNIVSTVQNAKARYPNLQLVYLSSRIYAGYATTSLNPEPYAYESAFAVRDVLTAQLNGDPALNFDAARGTANAPWLAWGPYLWADGTRARSDGLTWACSELAADGTHPSAAGRQKVAAMLLSFVKSDPTARLWFNR